MNTTTNAHDDLVDFYGYHPDYADTTISLVLNAYAQGESPRDVSIRLDVPASVTYALSVWGDLRQSEEVAA